MQKFLNLQKQQFSVTHLGLTDLSINEYNQLEPTQWPILNPNQKEGKVAQLFSNGQFSYADRGKVYSSKAIDPVNQIDREYVNSKY